MNADYASCVLRYLPQCLHMYIHMRMDAHMPTNTHTGNINEYVCPAEGKRTKINSSLVLFYTLSLPVRAE